MSLLAKLGGLFLTAKSLSFGAVKVTEPLWQSCKKASTLTTYFPSINTNLCKVSNLLKPSFANVQNISSRNYEMFSFQDDLSKFLKRRIAKGIPKFRRKRVTNTGGRPFLKAIVLKTLIIFPKKPNSAKRKCVNVRLSNGKESIAYIPKVGNNLQEHHTVLIRGGNVRDLPGVRLKCVRGKFDLQHVKKKQI